jgi:hypothetical protein
LGAVLSPTEVLPAVAAAGESVIRIFTGLVVLGGVPKENRDDWSGQLPPLRNRLTEAQN